MVNIVLHDEQYLRIMSRAGSHAIAHRAASAAGASPEHKRFKSLLEKIDKARERLRQWQEQAPQYAAAHAKRVQPLRDALMSGRRQWALELEQLLLSRRWSKADAETLTELICDFAGLLIESTDAPDPEMKALYARVAGIDVDAQAQQELAGLKAMMEEEMGLDLGDEPIESAEDLVTRAQAGMAQAQAAFEERRQARAGRKKKTSAAEQRAEQDRQRTSQTVREVYRKLAAALHPDRTPADASETQRQERSDAMARANAAYAAGDLLALLSLQLQIEQVDVAHAASVAADQVRHFNRLLAEQLAELEAEIDNRQGALCHGFGLIVERRLDPMKLGQLLQQEARGLEAAQHMLEQERRALRGPPAQTRRWLAQIRQQRREDELFF